MMKYLKNLCLVKQKQLFIRWSQNEVVGALPENVAPKLIQQPVLPLKPSQKGHLAHNAELAV